MIVLKPRQSSSIAFSLDRPSSCDNNYKKKKKTKELKAKNCFTVTQQNIPQCLSIFFFLNKSNSWRSQTIWELPWMNWKQVKNSFDRGFRIDPRQKWALSLSVHYKVIGPRKPQTHRAAKLIHPGRCFLLISISFFLSFVRNVRSELGRRQKASTNRFSSITFSDSNGYTIR